ncbi:MAG: Hsp20 family protein [Alphaproteobacteria bacterium]|nr:Hsp20 family protein [Alphaproteobacteria bacterium]
MNAFDFAPLFRTAIGFDRLARLVDATAKVDASYPPYNIEKTGDDSYRLTMAVAGFRPEEIDLTVQDNTLVVTGRVASEAPKAEVLYRGIAGRAFERRFVLADHIVVEGADLQHGLLHVGLKRVVPEALKPRRIPVGTQAPQLAAETAKAA